MRILTLKDILFGILTPARENIHKFNMGCGSSSAYPPWYWEDSEFSTQTDQRFATKTTVLETTYVAGNEDETKEVIDSNK